MVVDRALAAVGERLAEAAPPDVAGVALHRRLLVMVPMVTWGAGVVVAGLVTGDTRELDTLGEAGVVLLALSDRGDDYVVLVRSSFAGYLADWLLDAALEFTQNS